MEMNQLYAQMARARAFELALADLWHQGLISGELHLGTGEEAVAAGVAAHLVDGDALALDHRPTPLLVMRGVDLTALIKEMLGRPDGLCRGRGGHMHLFSPEHLAASSGIVGASGPLAVGFGLAASRLRKGRIGLAMFGEGAANQGMLIESLNLAAAWSLPVVFVCKDNGWAITTRSDKVTGGDLAERARTFGLEARAVDGLDVKAVHEAAGDLIAKARKGEPGFLLATCSRLDGHMLGDPMVQTARSPMGDGKEILAKVFSSTFTSGGAGFGARTAALTRMTNLLRLVRKDRRDSKRDPLVRTRRAWRSAATELDQMDAEARAEVAAAVEAALQGGAP